MSETTKVLRDRRALRKSEYISEVAKHTNIRESVVKMVYEGMVEVMAAEVANKGKFEIHEIVKISTKESNSGFAKDTLERMTAKLSNPLRRLRKLVLKGEVRNVEPRNVKEKLADLQAGKNSRKKELTLDDLIGDDDSEW